MNIRFVAAKTLAPILQQKSSLSANFDKQIADVPEKDRGLFHQLCFGSLRHYFSLVEILHTLMDKKLKNKDADVQAALLIGLYQLRHMRIPDHAAIAETVDAVKKMRKIWATKLTNAVLRSYLRDIDGINQKIKNLEYCHSHPQWLIDKTKQAWPAQWLKVLEANNQQAPLTLRVNNIQTSRDDYLKQLNSANLGVDAEACTLSRDGIRLLGPTEVTRLPGFKDGHISVQDEAAQLSAELLQLQAGQRVLDACCAPGGKTCHILEREPKLDELVAIELEEARMERVRENLNRLNLSANLIVSDALDINHWWDKQPFDRILLDAPCSATGVIRRHPDIKLLRRENDLANLSQLQRELLDTMWTLLKPGGILVYATCSALPEENTQVVEAFLAHNKNAKEQQIESDWGIKQTVGKQFLPTIGGNDGFYYACLTKLA